MSILIRSGDQGIRWDGIRATGAPPVLAPPAWALAERVWEMVGASFPDELPAIDPPGYAQVMAAAVPEGCRRLVLLVPDATRVGPWQLLLPEILRALNRTGVETRTLLVASGLHALPGRETLLRHLLPWSSDPEKELEGWAVNQNGDEDFRSHVDVGTTPAGTVVRLHPAYLGADWRILLGEVSYHYFAGFGGGRKLVFPGVAAPGGVARNHRRALRIDPARLRSPDRPGLDGIDWNPGCAPGNFQGNPVHEDLEAAAGLQPPNWALTAVDQPPEDPDPADSHRFPVQAIQGAYPSSLDQAVETYEASHRIEYTTRPSHLIVDAGGRPRDATFLQAHKSLQHAVRFGARRARILWIAECAQGLGSATLERYAAQGSEFRPLEGMEENPLQALHLQTLVALRWALEYSEVALWSSLDPGLVRALGLIPVGGEQEARDWLQAARGASWGWLPRAERFLPAGPGA